MLKTKSQGVLQTKVYILFSLNWIHFWDVCYWFILSQTSIST